MDSLETIVILLFIAVLLVGIAQKIHIPYPIVLVLAGTVIGFIPGLPPINIDPNLILLVVLPPILYYAAFGTAFREFQRNWRNIFSLALGLVVVTTLVIAVLFKFLFPQFSWPLAFAFGAIVSPPDAVAATAILKRFEISPRLVSLLEGESLINDASAIVLYKMSVLALLSGAFSLLEGGISFVRVVVGGVVVGVISGFLFQLFSRRYLEPVLGVLFSLTIPYITYLAADYLGVSGVLAVVVNGLIGSRILLIHHSPLRRVLGYTVWDVFNIFLNCIVFILIGLQLRSLTNMMTSHQMVMYSSYAFLVAFLMLIVRMIWVYSNAGFSYVKALRSHKSSTLCPQILRDAVIMGWSGMRGIVSLAVALSLPLTLSDGMPLEGRNEVIFITFIVILITLVIPGLTLPMLIRLMNTHPINDKINEEMIRDRLIDVVDEKLHQLLNSHHISKREFDFLRTYFISQNHVLKMFHGSEHGIQGFESARLKVIQAQRKKLLELWELQEIDDKLLMHMENELDVVEIHIARAELS